MIVALFVRQLMKSIRRSNVVVLSAATVLVVVLGTLGGYLAESPVNTQFKNLGDSLWWTLVTMSTVGYGDKVPITVWGRVIATICMVAGPILMVSVVGSIGVHLYDRWMKGVKGMAQVKSNAHVIICGWNWKAEDIINELNMSELRELPIAIIDDSIDTRPVDNPRISFVKGNASELRVLSRANIGAAKFAIVLAENNTPAADQKTVLTVLAIQKSNPSIVACAELNDANNEEHLREAGCRIIINASTLSSRLLAMSLQNPVVNTIVKELVSQGGNEVYRIVVPPKYVGRSFSGAMAEVKETHGVIAVGIEREGKVMLNPPGSEVLTEGDILLVLSEEPPRI